MRQRLALLLAGALASAAALAQKPDDGLVFQAAAALKGKQVAYLPIAMGFDLSEAWVSGLKKDAEHYGYDLRIRDPNWNVDAGAQVFAQLIQEKPDVIVVQPPEIQVYARLIQQAHRAGIPVVVVSLKASVNTDVFIGPDWYDMAVQQTRTMIKLCGKQHGGTGKIAVMQGVLTNPTSRYGIQAIEATVAESNGDVEIVSNQAADWDAGKAKAIATTVLRANPDLCGYIGMWDNMDVGIAAAIREAGRTDSVKLVSSGGGNQDSACSNLANDRFVAYISYDAASQARDVRMAVRTLLQNPPAKPGANPVALYTPLKTLDKASLEPGACWNLDTLQAQGS